MTLVISMTFDDIEHLERELASNLTVGGAFYPGEVDAEPGASCEIVLSHPANGATLSLLGRIVSAASGGTGLAIEGFDAETRRRIEEFVRAQGDGSRGRGHAESVHERLRGLSVVAAQRVAREGELAERQIAERLYGKIVWKELLDNPRVTVPEIARIAKMGSLPLPMLDQIVANRSWLASSQVRRALLTNPRLSRDQTVRVLGMLPAHELKLVPRQTAYTAQVRELARKLLEKR